MENPNKMENNVQNQVEQIINLIKRFWKKRVYVVIVTGAFMLFGLFLAFTIKEQYEAKIVFVPQVSNSSMNSLSSLTSLVGINLNSMEGNEGISPLVYYQILENVDFQKELMYTKIKFKDWEEPVSLIDYFTNPEYDHSTVLDYIVQYTIGLPWIILDALKNKEDDLSGGKTGRPIRKYSKEEYDCSEIFKEILYLNLDEKEGYFELSARMPEAYASAQLAEITFELLEKYVITLKLEKAQTTLDYVNARFDEAEAKFLSTQLAYAQFSDANRSLSSAVARIEDERLRKEYSMASTIYSELAKQKTQMELKVKEDTPVLTVVKPVVIPHKRVKPHRSTLMVLFTLLGLAVSCGSIIFFDDLKKKGASWPKKWSLNEEMKEGELMAESMEKR